MKKILTLMSFMLTVVSFTLWCTNALAASNFSSTMCYCNDPICFDNSSDTETDPYAEVMNQFSSNNNQIIDGLDTCNQILSNKVLNTLLNNGYCNVRFLGRYLQDGDAPNAMHKKITQKELKLLSASSIPIVSYYQLSADKRSCFTYSKGVTQAKDAIECALAIDQTKKTPIYFCVDFDPTCTDDRNAICDYFRGVSTVLANTSLNKRQYTLGIYGNANTLTLLKPIYPNARTILCGLGKNYQGVEFTNWDIRQELVSHILYSGSTEIAIDVLHGHANTCGAWLHTHKSWKNYGSAEKHRTYCSYCGCYIYASHVPNSAGNYCSFCGYRGTIIVQTPNKTEDDMD